MDGVIGSYLAMALLQSLEMVAGKKSVFNDEWMIARDGQTPVVIEPADGLRGITGKATNATPWVNTSQPGFMAPQAIDRYERDIRTTAVIPAEFGGESATNVRTGRRGDAILSAAIDFVVQEAQETFAPCCTAPTCRHRLRPQVVRPTQGVLHPQGPHPGAHLPAQAVGVGPPHRGLRLRRT
jgi:hypothetical protein